MQKSPRERIEELERLDQEVSRMVADGTITGFQALKIARGIAQDILTQKGRQFAISQSIRAQNDPREKRCLVPLNHGDG